VHTASILFPKGAKFFGFGATFLMVVGGLGVAAGCQTPLCAAMLMIFLMPTFALHSHWLKVLPAMAPVVKKAIGNDQAQNYFAFSTAIPFTLTRSASTTIWSFWRRHFISPCAAAAPSGWIICSASGWFGSSNRSRGSTMEDRGSLSSILLLRSSIFYPPSSIFHLRLLRERWRAD